jgi:hypothetical protein
MKKLLFIILLISNGFMHAAKPSNKLSKPVKHQAVKQQPEIKADDKNKITSESFDLDNFDLDNLDLDNLDEVLDENPDVLNQKNKKITFLQKYFTLPMTRLGSSAYAILPERVQLAILTGYLFAEEKYETLAEYLQAKYRSIGGIEEQEEDDDCEDQEDDSDSDNSCD